MDRTNENVGRVTHTHTHTHGYLKNKKAITLIALVITIIVLIILAGVAINLTLGDSGIFNRAKYARSEYLNAKSEEETKFSKVTNTINDIIDIASTRDSIIYEYSYNEKRMGTWVDGKPLYQKTYRGTTTSTSNTNAEIANISDLNYETVFIVNSYIEQTGGTTLPACCCGVIKIWRDQKKLIFKPTNSDGTSQTIYTTIQYTKTTD